jgi:hypothetical protein
MTEASAGVQYSEDGQYWWDGADWQPVDTGGSDSTSTDSTSTDSGEKQYSEDGQYWWDGSDWQPVQDQSVDEIETTGEPEIDWSNYPLLQGIYESTSVDEWLQYIGLEPDQLKVEQ